MIIVRPMTKVNSLPEITGVAEVSTPTNVSTLDFALPNADPGDLRVITVGYYNVTANVPSGWDVVGVGVQGFTRYSSISRRKQAGDPDTIALTFSNVTRIAARAWTIANGGTPTWVSNGGSTTTHTTPATFTTTKNNVILRGAFSTSTSYVWSSGVTPYSDVTTLSNGRLANAFQLSLAVESIPAVTIAASGFVEYSAATIVVGTYFAGPTTAQKATLTSAQTTTVNTNNEIGPWTAAGTHPGTTLVGNAFKVTNSGRATVTASIVRGGIFGNFTINMYLDGVQIATQTSAGNSSTVTFTTPAMDFEDGSLITFSFNSTTATSSSNIIQTSSYVEITPV